jgi:hypothetical protein
MQVTHESFMNRCCNKVCGAFVGMFLFFAAFAVLGYNEGRYIHTMYDIEDARNDAITLDCSQLASASSKQNQLVFASCNLDTATSVATDPHFNVAVNNVLYIHRTSQICQNTVRTQTTTNTGGSKTTTCSRTGSTWSTSTTMSSACSTFATNQAAVSGYNNVYGPATFYATNVALGQPGNGTVSIPPSFLSGLRAPGASCTSASSCSSAGSSCQSVNIATQPINNQGFIRNGNQYCNGVGTCQCMTQQDATNGNTRVSFQTQAPTRSQATVLATITGSSDFAPYKAKRGTTFQFLQEGTTTLADILTCLQNENVAMLYALRFLGWGMMWLGLALVFQAPAVFASCIPCIGGWVEGMIESIICCLTCPVATSLSLITVAIAWLFFRPAIAAGLLAAAAMVGGATWYFRKQQKDKQAAVAGDAPPPGPAGGAYAPHTDNMPIQPSAPAYPAQPQPGYPYPTAQAQAYPMAQPVVQQGGGYPDGSV